MSVNIIYENCIGCKSCYTECPADVYEWDGANNRPIVAYPDECSHCGICYMECKAGAVKHTLPLNCWIEINKRLISPITAPSSVEWPG